MAPLTWKEVSAPNFSGVSQSLALSGQLLSNATSGLSAAIQRRRENERENASSGLMAQALQYTSPEEMTAAMRSGAFSSEMLSPAAAEFIATRNQQMLRDQNAGLVNAGQGIANATNQQQLDAQRYNFGRTQAQHAAQPQALQAMVDIRTLAASGNPDDYALAQRKMGENAKLFESAGYNPDAVTGFIGGNMNSTEAGMGLQQRQAQQQDFFADRFRRDGKDGLRNAAVEYSLNADMAIDYINKTPGLDARTKSELVKDFQENAGTYWSVPNAANVPSMPRSGMGNAVIGQQPSTPGLAEPSATASFAQHAMNLPNARRNMEQSGYAYISYDLDGKKRSLPINQNLAQRMSFLGDMGVEMRVTSGGQRSNKPGEGTGTTAHNHGNAGDAQFIYQGRTLDMSKPQDEAIMEEIAYRAMKNGVFGLGAGKDYMGNNTMHIGLGQFPGQTTIWGSSGKRGSEAAFLRRAEQRFLSEGGKPSQPNSSSPAPNSTYANLSGSYGSPAAPATSMLSNAAQAPMSAPAAAAPAMLSNTVAPIAAPAQAPQLAQLEQQAAVTPPQGFEKMEGINRYKNGDRYLQGNGDGTFSPVSADGVPQSDERIASPVMAQVNEARAAAAASTVEPQRAAQLLGNTGAVSSAFQPGGFITEYMANPTFGNQSAAQVAAALTSEGGGKNKDGNSVPAGALSNYSKDQVENAINQLRRDIGSDIPAGMAAAILQESTIGKEDGSWWGAVPFSSSRFFDKDRTFDMEKARAIATRMLDPANGRGSTSGGVGALTDMQDRGTGRSTVEAQAQTLQQNAQLIQSIQYELSNPNLPEARRVQLISMLQELLLRQEQATATLGAVDASRVLSQNVNARMPMR